MSSELKRKKQYDEFLLLCQRQQACVQDIIQLGTRMMKKARLHHHFFGDYTLRDTAQSLTYHALQTQKSNLDLITKDEAKAVFELFEKRIKDRIPVPYLTQVATYLNHRFYVNEHVLVPRSLMNTRFQDFLDQTHWENHRVLDLCTGSGCIGITLALLNPKIQVDLADISPKALEVAQSNVARHGLENRVQCIQSNVFDNIHERYDLIITNPPYVSQAEYKASPKEFQQEPKLALVAGYDGLDVVHKILKGAKDHLNTHGTLVAEVGFTAAKRIKRQYKNAAFTWLKYRSPSGFVHWFSMPGVLMCEKRALNL